MESSADGRATFRGRSGQLGDDSDKAVFHALREQVDALLADRERLAAMAAASKALARPDAAQAVAQELLEAAGR